MATTSTSTEYGVEHLDGHVEEISEESANAGYMDANEYAEKRAQVSGGFVVSRTRQVLVSDWVAVDPEKAAEVRNRKVEIAVTNLRDTLLGSGYSSEQADAILAGVHDTLAVTEP